jgi:hypothetical protein
MNATTGCPGINSITARRRAIGVLAAGALLAFAGTDWPGTAEATVASSPVRLVDQATAAPLRVQAVDDSDQDEAQLQENTAIQAIIQSEQQAQQQNAQAQQQALQDELQGQQTEQQANQ